MCVLLSGFMGSGITECQIIYGTDDSYSNLPFMDTGSNTGIIITAALTATLQPRTTYYYIVTATSENVCARQQGSFTTGTCVFSTGCTKVLTVHIGTVNWSYMYTLRVSGSVCVGGGRRTSLSASSLLQNFSAITFQVTATNRKTIINSIFLF